MASEDFKINIVADTKHAIKSFKDLKGASDDAGGGVSGAMAGVGVGAAAAGAAVLAFATKSVMAFENLGLDVDKLSTATGLTSEAASRLIEVAGDVGVSSESLGTSIGKMEKTLGKNSDAFEKYGIQTKYAKDGTVDANATFLEAVDALNKIKDPTEKAAAGAEIFGKGWADMSQLIAQGGPELKANLAAVDSAKIFDDKKVNDAKNLRDAFDSIKDAGENLMLTLGSALAPVVAKLAPMFAKIIEAARPLIESIGKGLANAFEALAPILDLALAAIKPVITALTAVGDAVGWVVKQITGGGHQSMEEMVASAKALADAAAAAGISQEDLGKLLEANGGNVDKTTAAVIKLADAHTAAAVAGQHQSHGHESLADQEARVARAAEDANAQLEEAARLLEITKQHTEDLTTAYNVLKGTLNIEAEKINMKSDLNELEADAVALWKATADGSKDAAKMQEEYALKVIATKQAALDLLEQSKVPIEQALEVQTLINKGQYDAAQTLIDKLTAPKTLDIQTVISQVKQGRDANKMASGGIAKPGLTLVGEQGPELVMMNGGENVLTASQTASAMAGGGSSGSGASINLTVHAGLGTDGNAVGQQIVNMLKQYQRTNGPFDFTSR